MLGFLRISRKMGGKTRADRAGRRPSWEALESRQMLSGAGTNYTLMGGDWSEPTRITYSFAPDGVSWDRSINDLNARMQSSYGNDAWQDIITRSLQTWAASANLNFSRVEDGNYGFNASGRSQGDPRFGDIRIGGYDFDEEQMLARTYGPPPNGSTAAGDAELNTSFTFGDGSRYDLGTVILHELGHSLGLGESPQAEAAMYAYYSGVRQSLSPYDVEGIQSLYGPRVPDSYRASGWGGSAASAIDVTSRLDAGYLASLSGLSLSSIGDTEYFSVVAPNSPGATLEVTAAAQGISLLSPMVTVFDASGQAVATDARADRYGNNVQVAIPNAAPGQRYTIAVQGATGDVFSVGSYDLAVAFRGLPTPPAPNLPATPAPTPTPTTPTSTPTPIVTPVPSDRLEPNNAFASATELGASGMANVVGLTIDSKWDADFFTFTAPQAGTVRIASANVQILVADASARLVASGMGAVSFEAPQAGARYYLILTSPTGTPVAGYGVSVASTPAPKADLPASPPPTTTPTRPATRKQIKAAQQAARKAAQAAQKAALAQASARAQAARRATRALFATQSSRKNA